MISTDLIRLPNQSGRLGQLTHVANVTKGLIDPSPPEMFRRGSRLQLDLPFPMTKTTAGQRLTADLDAALARAAEDQGLAALEFTEMERRLVASAVEMADWVGGPHRVGHFEVEVGRFVGHVPPLASLHPRRRLALRNGQHLLARRPPMGGELDEHHPVVDANVSRMNASRTSALSRGRVPPQAQDPGTQALRTAEQRGICRTAAQARR